MMLSIFHSTNVSPPTSLVAINDPPQQFSLKAGSRTLAAAAQAFLGLSDNLSRITQYTTLPEDHFISGLKEPISNGLLTKRRTAPHRVRTMDAQAEMRRMREPESADVCRLVYLATLDGEMDEEGNPIRSPFDATDFHAFTASKSTRDRTYRWFKIGMIAFAVLSTLQGFSPYLFPSTQPRDNGSVIQGCITTVSGTVIAALGVLFTGLFPDISQDKLNEKVDKLNRVREKLDDVARTLITFFFHERYLVRTLAEAAAEEIDVELIKTVATHSKKYAITTEDIDPTLKMLRQAVDYVLNDVKPSHPDLNGFISRMLESVEKLKASGEWENDVENIENFT